MRYEDRSSMVEIRHLYHGLEASLDLYVKVAGGYQVRNKRSFKQRLFIFEISATDRGRTGREVVVWTFLSGHHAQRIIESYTKRFTPRRALHRLRQVGVGQTSADVFAAFE